MLFLAFEKFSVNHELLLTKIKHSGCDKNCLKIVREMREWGKQKWDFRY